MDPYLAHVHLKNSQLLDKGEQAERYPNSDAGQIFVSTPLKKGLIGC